MRLTYQEMSVLNINKNLFNTLFGIFLHFTQYSYLVDDSFFPGQPSKCLFHDISVIQTNRCDQPKCGRPVDILGRLWQWKSCVSQKLLCFGLGEDIWHAIGIGPGVQQQFKFTPGVLSTYFLFYLPIIFWDRNLLQTPASQHF